jgi:hypothetical protein
MRNANHETNDSKQAFNVVAFSEILEAQKRSGIHLSAQESLALMVQATGGKSLNDSVACIRAGLEKTGKIQKASYDQQQTIITQLLS